MFDLMFVGGHNIMKNRPMRAGLGWWADQEFRRSPPPTYGVRWHRGTCCGSPRPPQRGVKLVGAGLVHPGSLSCPSLLRGAPPPPCGKRRACKVLKIHRKTLGSAESARSAYGDLGASMGAGMGSGGGGGDGPNYRLPPPLVGVAGPGGSNGLLPPHRVKQALTMHRA